MNRRVMYFFAVLSIFVGILCSCGQVSDKDLYGEWAAGGFFFSSSSIDTSHVPVPFTESELDAGWCTESYNEELGENCWGGSLKTGECGIYFYDNNRFEFWFFDETIEGDWYITTEGENNICLEADNGESQLLSYKSGVLKMKYVDSQCVMYMFHKE